MTIMMALMILGTVNLISLLAYLGFEIGVQKQLNGNDWESGFTAALKSTSPKVLILAPWLELYILGLFINNRKLRWVWVNPF